VRIILFTSQNNTKTKKDGEDMNKSDANKDDSNHNEMEAPEDIVKDVEKYE